MDIQQIFAMIDDRKEELFRLLSDLVKIDSQNFSSHQEKTALLQMCFSNSVMKK